MDALTDLATETPKFSARELVSVSLRAFLLDTFGAEVARALLTQAGFIHGWRAADGGAAPNKGDLRLDGHSCRSIVELINRTSPPGKPATKDGYTVTRSIEAVTLLKDVAASRTPACWTTCGFISGYLSRIKQRDVFIVEDGCVGCGASACHFDERSSSGSAHPGDSNLSGFSTEYLKSRLDLALELMKKRSTTSTGNNENARPSPSPIPQVSGSVRIISESPAMQKALNLVERVAHTDSTILISGESGTGKERVARLIHDQSPRSNGPFVAINCGAISESLLDSELFGHARGAFTGANQARPGIFEAAHQGTLFLDEIGEVPPGMQVKLLRVLQEREVRRVGEINSRSFDARILTATNRELGALVEDGTFREDLYYRLRVVELRVPPLRERREDLLPLARELSSESAARMKRKLAGFSPEVAEQLQRHDWPGNVRELESAMERAVAVSQGSRIELEDLPDDVKNLGHQTRAVIQSVRPLQEISKDYILAALSLNNGNQTATARQLGIGSATLYRKLKRYGYEGSLQSDPSSEEE